MGLRNCFVPGCSTGNACTKRKNKLRGVKNNSMFKAKSESQLEKWRKAIPRKDKVLALTDRVCEVHFRPEDIIRSYETRMPDGTIDKRDRGVPLLKCEAVPTIFPNLPKYLSKESRTRKPPAERSFSEIGGQNLEEVIETSVESGNDNFDVYARHANDVSNPSEVTEEADYGNLNLLHLLADAAVKVSLYSVSALVEALGTLTLPDTSWTSARVGVNVVFLHVGVDFLTEKTVVIAEDLSYKVILKSQEVKLNAVQEVKSNEDVMELIGAIHNLRLCQGVRDDHRAYPKCAGYVTVKENRSRGRGPSSRCFHCKQARKQLADRERRQQLSTVRRKSWKVALTKCRVKASRLLTKVSDLKRHMEQLRLQASAKPAIILEAEVASLPVAQQEAIRACFESSKRVNSKGRRYSTNWIYECILLRIKSRKAYEHLRSHGILALPSAQTLSRYLEKVKGAYGFQEATFNCLKEKAQLLPSEERRGALLIDEMKLAQCVAFDRKDLKVHGFTDLGDHTPKHQKNQRGDHALVMMYQPFRGRWVQALSCFLSKGCASSTVLHHLILECIILLEKADFHVDLVVTDGAQWNRTMWRHFGIDSTNASCVHPVNPLRRLWFASDFPHLIKNVRNFFVKHEETWTPDGILKLRHWEAIVNLGNPCGFQLKACPFLTMDHVHPKPYQKMNVRRAFQFFSGKVAAAMKVCKGRHDDLEDCDPSIKIIQRVQDLILSLNSRTPLEALRKGSEKWKGLQEFLTYIEEWEKAAQKNNYYFLSGNTALGLKVSIRTALELYNFLEAECGFEYLMTARMNQDALERFFGMMRSACGSNDHPDSILFAQMFKLISTYSLVKPPKGSNVSGGDMLRTLMSTVDITDPQNRLDKLRDIMDGIIDKGSLAEDIPVVMEDDHNYHVLHSSDFVLGYFSGYVARKAKRFSSCGGCLKSVHCEGAPGDEGYNTFIHYVNKGHLTYSSKRLYDLISVLEMKTVQVLSKCQLNVDSVFQILEAVEDIDILPLVGCQEHCHMFTGAIVRFFVFTRMHFACKAANKADNVNQEKARLHRKMAKLN